MKQIGKIVKWKSVYYSARIRGYSLFIVFNIKIAWWKYLKYLNVTEIGKM